MMSANRAFRTIAAGAACLALVFSGGCFSSADGVGPDEETCVSASTVVMTNDLRFDARCVRVRAGESVLWTNPSPVGHTVTADQSKAANAANVSLPAGAEPFDSGNIPAGGTFTYTFSVPGRYEYVCLPHEGAGMVGTVIVEP